MGVKRFLGKTLIRTICPIYDYVDISKKVYQHGIKDGFKMKIREELLEDNPISSQIYKVGKYDGKQEGYVEASYEYEKKLLKQAEEFLNQKELAASKRREYQLLLDEYETYINKLEKKVEITEQEKDYLNQLLMAERKLRNLK